MLSESSLLVLHEVYAHLLSLLAHVKAYCGEYVIIVAVAMWLCRLFKADTFKLE